MKKKILQSPEDYCNWDKLIAHCDTIDELQEQEKQRAKQAFAFLREEFGAGFLKAASHSRHPIMSWICNLAPWTRIWMTRFAEALRSLQDANPTNFRELSRRLVDPKKFSEAMSVLETGYALFKAGFVVTFDAPINDAPGSRIADLKIIEPFSRQEMFAEVSIQHQGMQEKATEESFDRITSSLFMLHPDLEYCGQLHRTLSKTHLAHLVKKIEEMTKRVADHRIFEELVEEDIIDLAIAPAHQIPQIEQWAAARGLKPREFRGPAYQSAEVVRTKLKIREELKQLPQDRPGILCIFNNRLFLYTPELKTVIREFEEVIYDNPHVSILIFIGQWFGMQLERSERIREHFFILKTTDHGFSTEARLIISNRFASKTCSHEAWTRIVTAFEEHFGL